MDDINFTFLVITLNANGLSTEKILTGQVKKQDLTIL